MRCWRRLSRPWMSTICLVGLVIGLSESFPPPPPTTTTTTTISTRHLPIVIYHDHEHFFDFFDVSSNHYSFGRGGRITALSSQQQNTIEEKEKATTKTRRKNRSWEESYQLLVSYKEQHGNCNVPTIYKDDSRLGRWVSTQRKTKDKLSDECIAKFDGIGFLWANELYEEQWEVMFEKLVQYAKENDGDCNIPYNYGDDENKELFLWAKTQRLRKSLLSEERQSKLDKLGLIWEDANKVKADQKWNEQYESLKNYKEEHGDCRVPKRWEDDPTLGLWVCTQRQLYKKGQLREDRQIQLEEIDFTWKVRHRKAPDYVKLDFQWLVMYGILLNFLEEHGHCDVTYYYKKDRALAKWVSRQRENQKNGTLRQDRKEQLDDIGFTWSFDDQKDAQWNEKYQELKLFKEQNGHLRLHPGTSKSLIDWVTDQRVQFASGKVAMKRKALLDELGFRWKIHSKKT